MLRQLHNSLYCPIIFSINQCKCDRVYASINLIYLRSQLKRQTENEILAKFQLCFSFFPPKGTLGNSVPAGSLRKSYLNLNLRHLDRGSRIVAFKRSTSQGLYGDKAALLIRNESVYSPRSHLYTYSNLVHKTIQIVSEL